MNFMVQYLLVAYCPPLEGVGGGIDFHTSPFPAHIPNALPLQRGIWF